MTTKAELLAQTDQLQRLSDELKGVSDDLGESVDDLRQLVLGITDPPDPTPPPAGSTYRVNDYDDWLTAHRNAQGKDTVVVEDIINHRLTWEGSPDVTIAFSETGAVNGGNQSNGYGALDIYSDVRRLVDPHVVGSQFGIRLLGCQGTEDGWMLVENPQITGIGHAGFHIGANLRNRRNIPSAYIRVTNPAVSHCGQTNLQFGEGFYIGYGHEEWLDDTHDISVIDAEVHHGGGGIDVKPGTAAIELLRPLLHDLSPIHDGALSLHYAGATPNPHPERHDWVLVDGARIWNINQSGDGNNEYAVWIGHGGVTLVESRIWGIPDRRPYGTRAIRIRSPQPFGPHPIVVADNTLWVSNGWVAEGDPANDYIVEASRNRCPNSSSGEIVVTGAAFVGPIPPIGAADTADAGTGPGSAFDLFGA